MVPGLLADASTLHSPLGATSTKQKGKEIQTHTFRFSEICSLFGEQGKTTHSPPAQGLGTRRNGMKTPSRTHPPGAAGRERNPGSGVWSYHANEVGVVSVSPRRPWGGHHMYAPSGLEEGKERNRSEPGLGSGEARPGESARWWGRGGGRLRGAAHPRPSTRGQDVCPGGGREGAFTVT